MSKKKYKLSEIADFLGGKIYGDSSKDIYSLSSLKEAKEGSISFLYSKKFLKELNNSSASAILVSNEYKDKCNMDCIVVDDPMLHTQG